jgi:putative membrane protein
MMGWYDGGMGWAAWLFAGLFWLGLVALIVWLVVHLAVSGGRRSSLPPQGLETPLDILDRRLAQGEIDLETYRAHRAALLESRRGQP